MRFLLVMWLSLGLAPGLGEVVEAAVHFATAGHLAHTDAAHGDFADQGSEHGCGTTVHICSCCASQVIAVGATVKIAGSVKVETGMVPSGDYLASLHQPAPPYRPPIAS